MTDEKVLVTGASGFIGRALCGRLRDDGYRVIAGVRRSDAVVSPGVEMVTTGEIDGTTEWLPVLAGVGVVVHLAARVHVLRDGVADPLAQYRRVNVEGVRRLAEQAVEAGVQRLVFVSTIKVNGEDTDGRGPFTENDAAAPTDPYAISKWEAEQVLHSVARCSALEVVVLRPPLVYGPGVGANFERLMRMVSKRLPLPLASARNRRSLLYIYNFVDAIVRCMQHPAAAGGTFLVSDPVALSSAELVAQLSRGMGLRSNMLAIPPPLIRMVAHLLGRAEEYRRLFGSLEVDSRCLCETLNWSAPYATDYAIEATARHYVESLRGRPIGPNAGAVRK